MYFSLFWFQSFKTFMIWVSLIHFCEFFVWKSTHSLREKILVVFSTDPLYSMFHIPRTLPQNRHCCMKIHSAYKSCFASRTKQKKFSINHIFCFPAEKEHSFFKPNSNYYTNQYCSMKPFHVSRLILSFFYSPFFFFSLSAWKQKKNPFQSPQQLRQ